jgi:hypothetical protein
MVEILTCCQTGENNPHDRSDTEVASAKWQDSGKVGGSIWSISDHR